MLSLIVDVGLLGLVLFVQLVERFAEMLFHAFAQTLLVQRAAFAAYQSQGHPVQHIDQPRAVSSALRQASVFDTSLQARPRTLTRSWGEVVHHRGAHILEQSFPDGCALALLPK